MIGTGVLALIAPRSLERPADGALVATWIGTLLLALVWLAVSLIQPLVPIVTVTLAVLLVAGALLLPSVRTTLLHLVTGLSPWSVVGMLALLLGVAFLCTQTVTFFDTGLYHAGLIEWLSRFGSVPGLALIEYRFGFTSSWFALAAVFNQGPLHGRIDALPGGYALWLASVHLSVSLHRLMRAQAALADWLVAIAYLMLLAWAARVGITVSPSPDVPVMVMCVTVAWAMLVIGTGHVRDVTRFGPEAVPVLLSALAFALKPTVVPLLVVSLVFYALRRGVGGRLIVLCGLVAVLVLPVLATSLVTTGCPLFPSPILCSSLPWSVGSAAAAVDQSTGRVYLEWTGVTPPADANGWNWIPHWARSEPLGTITIAYMLVASLAALALSRWTKAFGAGWMAALGLLGVGWVLALSPTYRFLVGYAILPVAYLGAVLCFRRGLSAAVLVPPAAVAGAAVLLATVVDAHSNGLTLSARAYALIAPVGALTILVASALPRLAPPRVPQVGLTAAAVLVAALLASSNRTFAASDLAVPAPLSELAASDRVEHTMNDVRYSSPSGDRVCWAVIPCTIEPVDPRLHLRDPQRGVAGGFSLS